MELNKGEPKLLAILAIAANCCYGEPAEKSEKKLPTPQLDKELLEFLADFDEEFDGMDDDEFELLIHYGKKDSAKKDRDHKTNGETTKGTDKQEESRNE